ncbi:hypothetical protein DICPUDRAFT_82587 [Dictyostelium purpureum]|uniref:Uncharacterized protein n=1 Tax=Dictyostelium purpureum TaxID=5786 RepID=F0ZWZ1_DICPU|nr:uncharacterized protein DICPUDRAFT_82587 [Dictyostelium purpureum]EGC31538.1 hypothetical protein DICPUDRAFT_82587 [Dictyostelium purpureum]|eukprot:XP_003291938.1 hypothetical protein DICPUDRAFT_82587 [Dictyostelium purpureum]
MKPVIDQNGKEKNDVVVLNDCIKYNHNSSYIRIQKVMDDMPEYKISFFRDSGCSSLREYYNFTCPEHGKKGIISPIMDVYCFNSSYLPFSYFTVTVQNTTCPTFNISLNSNITSSCPNYQYFRATPVEPFFNYFTITYFHNNKKNYLSFMCTRQGVSVFSIGQENIMNIICGFTEIVLETEEPIPLDSRSSKLTNEKIILTLVLILSIFTFIPM